MIEWIVDKPGIRLGLGDSVTYDGDADLVFTHLYGPLPSQLIGKPAIINVFGNKKAKAEEWCGAELIEVSRWGRGLKNTIYVGNLARFDLDLCQYEEAPGGWFNECLVDDLINAADDEFRSRPVVFDGFMGRGTVGRVCRAYSFTYVGIDRDPARVEMAMDYLGC